jgi:predicted secreted protein
MAGEIFATDVVLADATGTIVGQMEGTITYNGTPVEITNKADGGFASTMSGVLANKSVTFSGTCVYNSDAQFRALKAAADNHTHGTYTIDYPSNATTDESITGTWGVSGWSDSAPVNDKLTCSFTLTTSGTYTRTAAVT